MADTGDWRISASGDRSDGYRRHSDGDRRSVQFNTGWRAGDTFGNRTWVSLTDLFLNIPFVVPKATMERDPRAVVGDGNSPQDRLLNVHHRDPLRDSSQRRIANLSEWGAPQLQQSVGLWWQHTDDLFKSPLVHDVSDTDTRGVQWQLASAGERIDYRFGASWTGSDTHRALYANNPQNGTRLQRFGNFELDASSIDLLAGVSLQAARDLRVLGDIKWSRSTRNDRDVDRGDGLGQRYSHTNPRIGTVWQLSQDSRLFANLSRSAEVPSWWEIVSGDAPPANPGAAVAELKPLREQSARTVEIGGEGSAAHRESRIHWSLAWYRSTVDDELIAIVDALGNRAGTYNYVGGTIHQGIEAGVDGQLSMQRDHGLQYRVAWTYSDFRFDDGVFAGNRLAGVPTQLISAELLWSTGTWRFGPNLRWMPHATPTDHANTPTIYQDAYALLGLKLDYTSHDGRWSAFLRGDNLTGRHYASSYVIRNQATLAQPGFLPGDGRNASVGITWRF